MGQYDNTLGGIYGSKIMLISRVLCEKIGLIFVAHLGQSAGQPW